MNVGDFKNEFLDELIKNKFDNNKEFLNALNNMGVDNKEDSIKKWRQGNSVPKTIHLPVIAEILGVNVNDFFVNYETSKIVNRELSKNPQSSVVFIDKVNYLAGAGMGGFLDVPETNEKVALDARSLFDYGLNPKYLKVVEVIGDSMEPVYREGENIIIDMLNNRDNFVKIAGTHVVRVGDIVYIKNVEFLPNNKIKLKSLNPKYDDMYPDKDGYDYEILGKVCGRLHLSRGFIFDDQGIRAKNK